ncbi:MAG: hypothetical protein WC435_02900 [Candidatus Paceibacterota bacterium]
MKIRIKNCDCQETAEKAVESGECEFAFIPFMNEKGGMETQVFGKGKTAQKLKEKLGERERTNGQVSDISSFLFLGVSSNQAENFIKDTFSHFRP